MAGLYLATAHGSGLHSARPTATAALAGYLYFETDTGILFRCDGAAWGIVALTFVPRVATVALAHADTGGGVLSWPNPESGSILVTRLIVDLTTKSDGACTLDFGRAADGTTLSDTSLDGVNAGASAAIFDTAFAANLGTNGKPTQKLASGEYLTGSMASGAAAGLVGTVYITYFTPAV